MTETDPLRGLIAAFSRRANDRRFPDGQLDPSDAAAYAEMVARAAHHAQTDKAGMQYIHHPERVSAAVAGDNTAVAVAWLHDVVEDTTATLADLAALFSPEIIDAVDAVTRRPGESPDTYYQRVRRNPLAVQVKLADIADNSAPTRLAFLDEKTRERLTLKYARARAALTE